VLEATTMTTGDLRPWVAANAGDWLGAAKRAVAAARRLAYVAYVVGPALLGAGLAWGIFGPVS
jgi:hypothetical protein